MKLRTIFYYLVFFSLYSCPPGPGPGYEGTDAPPTPQENIQTCQPDEECSFWWENGDDICICQQSNQENCSWECYSMACNDLAGLDKERCERRKKEEFESLLQRPVVMNGPIPTGHDTKWRIRDMATGKSQIYKRSDNIFIQPGKEYEIQIIPYKMYGNKLVRLSPKKAKNFIQNTAFNVPNQPNVNVIRQAGSTFTIKTTSAFKGELKINAKSSASLGNMKIYNTGKIPKKLRGKPGKLAPEFKTRTLILPNQGQISPIQLNKLKTGTLRGN